MTEAKSMIVECRHAPPVRSQVWRQMVEYRLRLGYGVEDIAIQLHCNVIRVREYVGDLRANGILAQWWRR